MSGHEARTWHAPSSHLRGDGCLNASPTLGTQCARSPSPTHVSPNPALCNQGINRRFSSPVAGTALGHAVSSGDAAHTTLRPPCQEAKGARNERSGKLAFAPKAAPPHPCAVQWQRSACPSRAPSRRAIPSIRCRPSPFTDTRPREKAGCTTPAQASSAPRGPQPKSRVRAEGLRFPPGEGTTGL